MSHLPRETRLESTESFSRIASCCSEHSGPFVRIARMSRPWASGRRRVALRFGSSCMRDAAGTPISGASHGSLHAHWKGKDSHQLLTVFPDRFWNTSPIRSNTANPPYRSRKGGAPFTFCLMGQMERVVFVPGPMAVTNVLRRLCRDMDIQAEQLPQPLHGACFGRQWAR